MEMIKNKRYISHFMEQTNFRALFSFDVENITNLYLFHQGEYIIKAREMPEHLYFLAQGEVRYAYQSEGGKYILFGGADTFTVFGEVSALWKTRPSNSVVAHSDSLCFGIPLEQYRELLLNDNTFLRYISRTMALRLSRQNDNNISYLSAPLERKLASFILQNSKNNAFHSSLTECSNTLGISYRHLIRTLNRFIENGILYKEKRKYYISDYTALYKLGSDTYAYYE